MVRSGMLEGAFISWFMVYRVTVANTDTGVISIIISVCVVGEGEL